MSEAGESETSLTSGRSSLQPRPVYGRNCFSFFRCLIFKDSFSRWGRGTNHLKWTFGEVHISAFSCRFAFGEGRRSFVFSFSSTSSSSSYTIPHVPFQIQSPDLPESNISLGI